MKKLQEAIDAAKKNEAADDFTTSIAVDAAADFVTSISKQVDAMLDELKSNENVSRVPLKGTVTDNIEKTVLKILKEYLK